MYHPSRKEVAGRTREVVKVTDSYRTLLDEVVEMGRCLRPSVIRPVVCVSVRERVRNFHRIMYVGPCD